MEFNSDLLRGLRSVYEKSIDPVFDETFTLEFYKEWRALADRADHGDIECEGLAESWYELNMVDDSIDLKEETKISNWLVDILDTRNFTCIESLSHDARMSYVERKIEDWLKSNVGNGITLSYNYHAMSGWGEKYLPNDDHSVIDAWCSACDFATLRVRFHDPDYYDDPTESVDMDEFVDTVSGPIQDDETDVQMMYLHSDKTVATDGHGLEYHPIGYFHARFVTDEGMEKLRDLISEKYLCAEIKFKRIFDSDESLHSFSMRLTS